MGRRAKKERGLSDSSSEADQTGIGGEAPADLRERRALLKKAGLAAAGAAGLLGTGLAGTAEAANSPAYTNVANNFTVGPQTVTPTAGQKGVIVKAVSGQTANLLEAQDSSGRGLVQIGSGGDLFLRGPRPWVDVRAYGATGNGTTDDTAAIQAAIDATPTAGTTFFPAGVYKFSTLTVTNAKRLLGSGWTCTDSAVFGVAGHGDWYGSVLLSTATSGTAINFNPTSFLSAFRMEHLFVAGPGSGTSTGIQVGNGSYGAGQAHFQDVRVDNFATAWGLTFVEDSTFIACRARGCHTGFSLTNNTNQNVFLNTEVQFFDVAGIVLDAACYTNEFYGGLLQNIYGGSGLAVPNQNLNQFRTFHIENAAADCHAISGQGLFHGIWIAPDTAHVMDIVLTGGSALEDVTWNGDIRLTLSGPANKIGTFFGGTGNNFITDTSTSTIWLSPNFYGLRVTTDTASFDAVRVGGGQPLRGLYAVVVQINPGSIANAAVWQGDVAVPGTQIGDIVVVGTDPNWVSNPAGVFYQGEPFGADTVRVTLFNLSGSAYDPPNHNIRIMVFHPQ